MSNSLNSKDFRLLLPEVIWLEPENLLLAKRISSGASSSNPRESWQTYLNTIGLLAFEQWLDNHLPSQLLSRDTTFIETGGNLNAGEFKFCTIATEHLLDETVVIPQNVIEQPEKTAHFYVVLEVSEEEQEVTIRGFLSHKQLMEIRNDLKLPMRDGCFQIPLSLFDIEPNHLLFYNRYSEPSEFILPQVESQVSVVNPSEFVNSTRTKLSEWFQGLVDAGWQAIDSLSNPELNLAFSTRNMVQGTKRAKIIDLGIQLGNQKVALLVNVLPENQDKINVLIQLYPTNRERFVTENIQLLLLSKGGKKLQEVNSRFQDNFIQLKPFKGEPGKQFSVQISCENLIVNEHFEL
ncbi:MAG: DUF1822 family protein [Cyanobacteria bacterium P01_D01_bin.50]